MCLKACNKCFKKQKEKIINVEANFDEIDTSLLYTNID